MENLKEYQTQEVMQYAIVLIDKLGFVPSKQEDNTKTLLFRLLEDFDRTQEDLYRKYDIDIDTLNIYSDEVEEKADEVLQYFSNIDLSRLGNAREMFKNIKEVSLNYFSTAREFGTICFMYHTYSKRKALLTREQEAMLV